MKTPMILATISTVRPHQVTVAIGVNEARKQTRLRSISCITYRAFLFVFTTLTAFAGPSSANYQITVETTGAGSDGAISGGVYSMNGSIGEIGNLSSGGSTTIVVNRSGFVGQLPSFIAGRWIFYNQSAWDANNAAANANDDAAIATDKSALLPGGTATFANYTSYSRGINGIMVDVTELSAIPTASHFGFKKGNDNTPSGWAAAPTPAVTVRWGAGVGGSDRVTLIWPNNAVQKTWLEVRVIADAATGLREDDFFYFGNAIGDVGDSTLNAIVNALDASKVRVNQRNSDNLAPIDFRYDINRDRIVNALDATPIRVNTTSSDTALALIHVTGSLHALDSTRAPAGRTPDDFAWLDVQRLDSGLVQVKFQGPAQSDPLLEGSNDLSGTLWETVPVNNQTRGPQGEWQWTLPVDQQHQATFYRVRLAPSAPR